LPLYDFFGLHFFLFFSFVAFTNAPHELKP